jgi:glucoamylase
MAGAGSVNARAPAREENSLLLDWMVRQYHVSAAAMLGCISATHLVKERPGFGQTIRPQKGSILASPVLASWDPDPDYFFHWLRDSATVIDALRHLIEDGICGEEGLGHCKDFVAFSHRLNHLDGGVFLRQAGDFRAAVDPAFLQFVRDDKDLASITGDRVFGEPRFNPDAMLDISKWSRPQHDGPAVRALALLRFRPFDVFDPQTRDSIHALIKTDLSFVHRHWRAPCFDIWEEEFGQHYYTRLVYEAALTDGAQWLDEIGESDRAQAFRETAREIAKSLDDYWDQAKGFYVSRRDVVNGTSGKDLDFATILAVIHARRKEGAHSVLDPKVLATLARLEALFETSYPINRGQAAQQGPALGRYAGDNYFSGGAYYFSTLGAAEFYFSLAEKVAAGAELLVTPENKEILIRLGVTDDALASASMEHRKDLARTLLGRGDQFMATVAAYTPASGQLSEQFDQTTGIQTSAKTLAWSHAAFITAFARRKAALRALATGLARIGAAQ